MPPSVSVRCPAKVNLFLEVLGRRPDGYHDIETLMSTVTEPADEVEVRESGHDGVTVICRDGSVPTDERNTCYRVAALIMREAGARTGVEVRLSKRIPVGSGLGGGSSDAVGTMLALSTLWRLAIPTSRMVEIAAEVGSDCPFFLTGGVAVCSGRGERVEPVAIAAPVPLAIAWPGVPVSTAAVYGSLGSADLTGPRTGVRMFRAVLEAGDIEAAGRAMFNRLGPVAEGLAPEVRVLRRRFMDLGAVGAVVTGSGSAVVAMVRDGLDARRIARAVGGEAWWAWTKA